VTDVDNVFRYGGSGESNGHSIASQERQPAEGGDVTPPKRPPIRTEPAPDPRGGGGVTGRLVLVALILILLGTGAGLAGALALPKTYGARAEILYPIGQDQQGGDPLRQDRQLSTQLVFLKSRAVLGPIAQKQGMQYKELDENLSVEVLQTSEVIQVEAHGSTKESARQTLQAVVDGYLALADQPSGVTRNLDTQLVEARANTARIQTQVEQLTAGVLAGTATQIALNEARTQLTASIDREKAIQVRIDEINLTGRSGPNAQLLTPPYVLPDPVSPQPLIAAGTGALVGLLVAAGVVAVRARRRTRP
jgi:capsular polysaccharide biosynthesis protein